MLTQTDHSHHHHLHHHPHHHSGHHHHQGQQPSFAAPDGHSMATHPRQPPPAPSSPPAIINLRPFSDLLSAGSVVHSGDLFGPVPNLFKWLQRQMTALEANLARCKSPNSSASPSSPTGSGSNNNNSSDHHQLIDIAMNKEEQNLEIVYHQGGYYLEAVHSFRVSLCESEQSPVNLQSEPEKADCQADQVDKIVCDARPKAWLAKEIEQKLSLKPGKSWLNGVETYHCLMCNQFSPHANLLLLHMILTCPKLTVGKSEGSQQQINHSPSDGVYPMVSKDSNNNNNNHNGNLQSQLSSPSSKAPNCGATQPRRSFDIMSLLQQKQGEENCTRISTASPEYSRISSDDEAGADCAAGGHGESGNHLEEDEEEEDSDEKIDVEALEETEDFGTAGALSSSLNQPFGLLKPAVSLSEMAASPLSAASRHYQTLFSNGGSGNRAATNSARGSTGKYSRGKSAKNAARGSSRTANSKGANYHSQSRKMKATEPESLELLHPSSQVFSALQRGKGEGLAAVPSSSNLNLPNLASLYSQFGPSLFANTFASFFNPPQSGPSHLLGPNHPASTLTHNSSAAAAASSLLGPALEQVFSASTGSSYPSVPSLPLHPPPPPPPPQSLFSPTITTNSSSSPHHFGQLSLSGKQYGGSQNHQNHQPQQHSPSSGLKAGGLHISPYHRSQHHSFEHQSLGGGHGSSSLITASNSSPSSTLSDSQSGGGRSPASGGSPSSSSSSTNSLSPCISLSPKSEYDQISSERKQHHRGSTSGHTRKESGIKSRKNNSHQHHHQSRSSQSPTSSAAAAAATSSGALSVQAAASNNSSAGSALSLPPYFLPPSSTASSPLISSMYLLSPSLTALSYQASNVCAYCGTAFRMTSDLVYHMRSHHKKLARGGGFSGSGDGSSDGSGGKKRRNDALKCNICQETFRERHHLTRHMTSHQ